MMKLKGKKEFQIGDEPNFDEHLSYEGDDDDHLNSLNNDGTPKEFLVPSRIISTPTKSCKNAGAPTATNSSDFFDEP